MVTTLRVRPDVLLMFREYSLASLEYGWFEIRLRDTPAGSWRVVATVYGNARAAFLIAALRETTSV